MFHEGCCVGLLLRILLYEEENDSLEQLLRSISTISLNEVQEELLILVPILDDVTLVVEETAYQNVVTVLRSEIHGDLESLQLSDDLVLGSFLFNELVDLGDCSLYRKVNELYMIVVMVGQNCRTDASV